MAELKGEEADALWGYLCKQWDQENDVVNKNPGRQLLRYNFFMLQADVLPNMAFSSTRKRLVHSYECVKDSSFLQEGEKEKDAEEDERYPTTTSTMMDDSSKGEL